MDEKKKMTSFSTTVLERFLSEDQINDLTEKYMQNKRAGFKNRQTQLREPVTEQELDMLRDWVSQPEQSSKTLAQKYEVNPKTFEYKVHRIATRYVAQKHVDVK